MTQVLYRKYRPQNFAEIVGQKHIVAVLQSALKQDRISHAYLFSGPRGTGKTTVARILARAANCKDKSSSSKPCGKCESCNNFASGDTLDLVEIDAASSRGIDEIRALKEGIQVLPFKSKYKIYIIDEVHMLTKEAFNALLKTLEEPPSHIIFILATTEIDKVPETIISRTQHFEFRRIPEEILQEALKVIAKKEGIIIEAEATSIISVLADGSLRDAQSMLDQISAYESKITTEEVRLIFGTPTTEMLEKFTGALLKGDTKEALSLVRHGTDENLDMGAFLKLIIHAFRSLLYSYINGKENEELSRFFLKNKVSSFSLEDIDLRKVEMILSNLNDAQNLMKFSSLPQLSIELAVLKIINAKKE